MASASTLRLKGRHVLIAMLLFFGVVIGINVAFIVAAVQSFPGEDVRRSYLQGLNYNETLADRRAQAARGWQAHAALAQGAAGVELQVRLEDAQGNPLDGAAVTGELRWPTDSRLDRDGVRFEPRGGGLYVARFDALRPGRWNLRAQANDGDAGGLDFEAELTWLPTR